MRIAYLILAHHRPAQLVRIVHRLNGPGRRFYVHVDLKAAPEVMDEAKAALRPLGNVVFVERVSCTWGGLSQVTAILKCLSAALADPEEFDVAVLLSGQDYPIKSNEEIDAFFSARRGRSFLLHWRLPSPRWANEAGGFERCLYWNVRVGRRFFPIFGPRGFGNRVIDRAWNMAARRLPLTRRFIDGMVPYGGPTWWTMSRACAGYVLRFVAEHPRYTSFFRWVKMPDEMYFQTLVMNSPYAGEVVNASVHYTSWPPLGATSPRILTTEAQASLERAPELYARKFDVAVDAAILDRLDRRIESRAREPALL